MKRNFFFFNIAPYSPGNEEQLAQNMVEYQQQTGNDLVLYSLTLHPEGRPAMNKVWAALKSYQILKRKLQGTQVKLGVLFQAILGHWPRVDKDEEPWTRSVNIDGEKVRYCILDPNFQDYITQTVTLFAKEKPAFILGDDDIRSFSHRPEGFCQRHTDEFNRRFKTNFTPEQLRKAVADSKVGDPVYNNYESLRKEIVTTVVTLIRKAIDAVDPSIPAGTCMPGEEYRFNGNAAKIIAGTHDPVMRICNANYMENGNKEFPQIVLRTQVLRQAHPHIPIVLDEADTCPHNLYSRSATSMHAKLCSSIMSDLRGAKLWYVNASKNGYPVNRNYTQILAQNSGFYQTLTDEALSSQLTGVRIPAHKNFDQWHPNGVLQPFVEYITWATILGRFGIPFRATFDYDQKGVYAISGQEAARRFSDQEINAMMKQGLLLDGPAAAMLSQRGFSQLMGVNAEMMDFRYNAELNLLDNLPLAMSKSADAPHLTILDPQHAQVLTELQFAPYTGAMEKEDVAPGTVVYHNSLGGTVCTTTYNMNIPFSQFNERRKLWLVNVLQRLNGGKTPPYLENQQDMLALTRQKKNGETILAVFNLNYDPAQTIQLHWTDNLAELNRLDGTGTWEPMTFTREQDTVTVPLTLNCYQCAVFRLK